MHTSKKALLGFSSLVCLFSIVRAQAVAEPAATHPATKTAVVRAASQPTISKPASAKPEQDEVKQVIVAQLSPTDHPVISKPTSVAQKSSRAVKAVSKPKYVQVAQVIDEDEEDQGFVSRVMSATKGMIDRAVSWLGTSYRWGGSSKNGIDCSGLTRQVYKGEGIGLPHNARLQYKKGKPVAKTAMLPGDLVFFNTRGPLTHVGIYIGDNKFVHAANRRRGVRVDSLSSPYYTKYFAGARRYKNIDLG